MSHRISQPCGVLCSEPCRLVLFPRFSLLGPVARSEPHRKTSAAQSDKRGQGSERATRATAVPWVEAVGVCACRAAEKGPREVVTLKIYAASAPACLPACEPRRARSPDFILILHSHSALAIHHLLSSSSRPRRPAAHPAPPPHPCADAVARRGAVWAWSLPAVAGAARPWPGAAAGRGCASASALAMAPQSARVCHGLSIAARLPRPPRRATPRPPPRLRQLG